jgi:hypothetical protein
LVVVYKWEIIRTKTFLDLFRSKDAIIKKKTAELIDTLALADQPWRFGEKKHGDFLAADFTKGDRLAFTVNGAEKRVYLLKVCDHKEIYGKD